MSEAKSGSSGTRRIWIGGAIAAAAVILVMQYVDLPPSKDMTGTIVPAQRFRAPQSGAENVKAGGQPGTTSTPVNASDLTSATKQAISNQATANRAASNQTQAAASQAARSSTELYGRKSGEGQK